jgi:hypothetical protein
MIDSVVEKGRQMSAIAEQEELVVREGLERFLERLIAQRDGVRPEDVTEEYIRRKRAERVYPIARFEIGSNYGGYDTTGLQVLTRAEVDEAEVRAQRAASALGIEAK